MLHPSPRTKCPAPPALLAALKHCGIDFKHSVWQIEKQLQRDQDEPSLIQAYLRAAGIEHHIHRQIGLDEATHLNAPAIVKTEHGHLMFISDKQEFQHNLLWAVEIAREGKFEEASRQTQAEPEGLFSFWKKLRDSTWFRRAIEFDWKAFKPIVYASVLINVLALAAPLFSLQVYDRIIPNQAYASMFALLFGVALCLGFEHVLKHARHGLMELAASAMDSRCAQNLSKALLRTRQHQTEPTALLQHLRSFEQLRELLTGVFLLTFIDLPFIAVFLVVIAIIHPLLLLTVIVAMSLTCLQIIASHRCMAKTGQSHMQATRNAHNQWFTTLSGLDAIQAHGTEELFADRLNRLQFKARQTANASRTHLFNASQRLHLVQQGTWVFTISFGVYLIIEQQLTVGGLIAASMLSLRCFAPLQRLHGHVVQTHAAQASFQELDQFMGQLEHHNTAHTHALERPSRVALEQVSVGKPGQANSKGNTNANTILQAIDLTFHCGSRIGIIGPTGSGKTSLLKLLARQFEPSTGQFTINHLDVQHIHPSELGMHIGYSVQPPSLIKGSLLENIRFERPHIDVKDCREIIESLGMAQWVDEHKDGIHMQIESHGSNLSSGQKQLISLCRALVGAPALVLLDEPTVCLDQSTENRLIQCLERFPVNSMLVFTTHKLNLLKCADQLVLMNKGSIHAQGDKAEVLHRANELSRQQTDQPRQTTRQETHS